MSDEIDDGEGVAADDEPATGDEHLAQIVPIGELTREATYRRLSELTRRVDGVPAEVAASAGDAYRWRSVDDELAMLVFDSAREDAPLEAARWLPGATRQLTFQAPDVILEVELTTAAPRELTCQVVPPQPAVLEVRHRGGTIEAEPDEYGTFHLCPLPRGPVSLRCRPLSGDAGPVATSWVSL